MKYCTVIVSFNSASLTQRVYDELLRNKKHDIFVIENSTTEEQKFKGENVIDIGRKNVGYGGCHDFILSNPIFRKYDFVGVFNNDVFDIPEDYIETLEKYMKDDVGILSSSIKVGGSGWLQMIERTPNIDGYRNVLHVEDMAAYLNTVLFDEYCKYMPMDYYGVLDISLCAISDSKGFKNIVVDEVAIGHMLSGGRAMAGTKEAYMAENGKTHGEWMTRCPELDKLYQNFLLKLK
jgi:GT2 family glycosyltransferase